MFALQSTNKTLKSHTGIDNVHRQRFERTISLAVELHEHDIPYLYHLGVVLVDELASRHLGLLFWSAGVEVNLGARTARTCVAHLPEIVVLVAVDDMVGRHMLCPIACCLIIAHEVFFLRTLEHCNIEIFGVELQHIHKIFPCHVDGSFLEVVTKAPVAEHLEHCVMVCVMPYLFEVVVLAANA